MTIPFFASGDEIANGGTGTTGESRASAFALLKEKFGKNFGVLVQTQTKMAQFLGTQKSAGPMYGTRTVNAMITSLPQSVGMPAAEGARLVSPSVGNRANPELLVRYRQGRLRHTRQVRDAAKQGKKAAFARILMQNLQDAKKQIALHADRNYLHGPNDILGTVQSYNSGTNVITLQGPDTRDSDAANFFQVGGWHVQPNMFIDYVAAANGIVGDPTYSDADMLAADEIQISSVDVDSDPDNPTVTLTSTGGTRAEATTAPAVGDFLILGGSRAADVDGGTTGKEEAGLFGTNGVLALPGTVTQTYLYGLSKSTYKQLQAKHVHNSGTRRAYTEKLSRVLIDRLEIEGKGDTPDTMIQSHAHCREAVAEHEGQRRYPSVFIRSGNGQVEFLHGSARLQRNVFWMCPTGMEIHTKKAHWDRYEQSGLDVMESRFVDSYLSDEIPIYQAENLENTCPFSTGVLDDLQGDSFDVTA